MIVFTNLIIASAMLCATVAVFLGTVALCEWLYKILNYYGFFEKCEALFSSLNPFKKKEVVLEYNDEFEEFLGGEYEVTGLVAGTGHLSFDAGTTISFDPKIQEQINALSADLLRVEDMLEDTMLEVTNCIGRLHDRIVKLEDKQIPKKKTIKRKTK